MGIAVTETSTKLFASQLNEIFRKMSSISAIVFAVVWTTLALAATDKKGDVKMVDLAEELAQSRQDLAKAREETKQETNKLKEEDHKIKEQAEKLKEKNDKLQQELTKLRHELHQANTDMKTTIRQKDQNDTQELKKMMKAQIEEYLKENKLCVAGKFYKVTGGDTRSNEWIDVDFKYTFPRVPTFTASLNGVGLMKPLDFGYNGLQVDRSEYPAKVTRSSAKCRIFSTKRWTYFEVSWIACL